MATQQSGVTFSNFQSPFSWRYSSKQMRELWSERTKRLLWRRMWVALAEAEAVHGLVTEAELEDLRAHAENIDIERAHEIESSLHHDLMAEVRTYAEQATTGGGRIHLGATSADIEDNADIIRIREASKIVLDELTALLGIFTDKIEEYRAIPVMAFTHLQAAEPTTLGYRLAQYAQDLLWDHQQLAYTLTFIRGKGMKGAVGTAAGYTHLLGTHDAADALEQRVMEQVGLEPVQVSTQVYPRKIDWLALSVLASIAASLHRWALDVRLLQAPGIGELSEPFGSAQVGSSAMPFKRNPINTEKICSLARYVAALPGVAWSNAALSMLERTLDESANRRIILPEGFLAVDEMLNVSRRVMKGIRFDAIAAKRNMAAYAPYANTEALLMALVRAGGNRQELHEVIRRCTLATREQATLDNVAPTLINCLNVDPAISRLLPADQVASLINGEAEDYVGTAIRRCDRIVQTIREYLAK